MDEVFGGYAKIEGGKFGNKEFKVMKQYLPGPYTFILPALSKLPKAFKGRRTVGIRIPSNSVACAESI